MNDIENDHDNEHQLKVGKEKVMKMFDKKQTESKNNNSLSASSILQQNQMNQSPRVRSDFRIRNVKLIESENKELKNKSNVVGGNMNQNMNVSIYEKKMVYNFEGKEFNIEYQ